MSNLVLFIIGVVLGVAVTAYADKLVYASAIKHFEFEKYKTRQKHLVKMRTKRQIIGKLANQLDEVYKSGVIETI